MLHAVHDAFLHEVTAHLESLGYSTGEVTYHQALEGETLEKLKHCDVVAAHYIRTRADRFALNNERCFQYDAKTSSADDIMLEALPVAFHIAHAVWDVETLYCYRNTRHGVDRGMWINPEFGAMVNRVQFPLFRWRDRADEMERMRANWQEVFPNADFVHCAGGISGDPHIVIPNTAISFFPHWKSVVPIESRNVST